MTTRATLLIDLQNEYLPSGKLPLAGIGAATANAARVLAAARAHGETVIHIRHEVPAPGAPFFVPGTPGAAIIPAVSDAHGEHVVVKNHPNAFRDTGLKAVLDDAGTDTIVILGAMSHMCVEATARAAADFGYETVVIHDACATLDLTFGEVTVPATQVHAASMAALAFSYARLPSTEEWLASAPDHR